MLTIIECGDSLSRSHFWLLIRNAAAVTAAVVVVVVNTSKKNICGVFDNDANELLYALQRILLQIICALLYSLT